MLGPKFGILQIISSIPLTYSCKSCEEPENNIAVWSLNVISQIFDLTLIGMCLLIMMIILKFYFILGQGAHCIWTWWFVLYIGHNPITDDICICLFVLGMEPEAQDWWDVWCWARSSRTHEYLPLCWARSSGTHEKITQCVGNKPWSLPCWCWA